jgi:serine phosphatase RsbU (regulator of sigma subunit)
MTDLIKKPPFLGKRASTEKDRQLGIGPIFSGLIAFFMVTLGVALSFTALNIMTKEKTGDTWAIVFLQLEKEIHAIEKNLLEHPEANASTPLSAQILQDSPPDGIFGLSADNTAEVVFGSFENYITNPVDLAIFNSDSPFTVWQYLGQDYLIRKLDRETFSKALYRFDGGESESFVLIWEVDVASWSSQMQNSMEEIKSYITTKSGKLIQTNDSTITSFNLLDRRMVQEFVAAPISKGQLEVQDDKLGEIHGVFNQVTLSNLVIFLEIPTSVTLAPVREMTSTTIFIFVSLLTGCIFLLQWPLGHLIAPLTEMAALAKIVQSGNFDKTTKTRKKGFGELKSLTKTFDNMIDGLIEKDEAIEIYIEEQKESFRLAAELKVAQGIQENLITNDPLPKESGVLLSTKYIPSEECAGDWYSYHYDIENEVLIVAMADVTGHGAGSAMFTAIIATHFDQNRNSPGEFDTNKFLLGLNRAFITLGKSQWHTTFTLMRFKKGDEHLSATYAAALPIHQVAVVEGTPELKRHAGRSDIVGAYDKPRFETKKIPVKKNDIFVIFTDGLNEAINPREKSFGVRRIKKSLLNHAKQPTGAIVNGLVNDWNEFREKVHPDDDVCIVCFKIL